MNLKLKKKSDYKIFLWVRKHLAKQQI